jgi:hypothetical protein
MRRLSLTTEDLDRNSTDGHLVRAWRVEQLQMLGLPFVLADLLADRVDWHALANLIDRGCPLHLALDIVL